MRSIRFLFPLIFVLQIFLAVGLTGAIAYVSQTKEARETAKEILDLVGSTMDEQLFKFLSAPVSLTELLAEEVRQRPRLRFDDLLSPNQIQFMTSVIWAQSRLSRMVNLSLVNPAGQSVRIDRKEYGKQILKMSDIRRGGDVSWFSLDSRGQTGTPLEVQRIGYDPREEHHYREALRSKQLTLSPVYFSALVRGAPVVTVAEAVYDARERLRVVVSSDIYLDGISGYLRGMRLPPHSVAFVFDRAGHLVASSELETQTITKPGEHPDRTLLSVLQSTIPMIRATGEQLFTRLGSFTVPEMTLFQYATDGQDQYVYATHLFTEFGLDWNIAVVIAEDGLIQNLLKGIQWTTWLSSALLTLAIGVGLLTAGWMIRPILTLRAVASALERDDLDDGHLQVRQLEKDTGRLDEFGTLAQTFLTMIREVRARHTLLESQLEQLRVGVDHDAAARQVAAISNTEFFRDLKQKTLELRRAPRRAAAAVGSETLTPLEP